MAKTNDKKAEGEGGEPLDGKIEEIQSRFTKPPTGRYINKISPGYAIRLREGVTIRDQRGAARTQEGVVWAEFTRVDPGAPERAYGFIDLNGLEVVKSGKEKLQDLCAIMESSEDYGADVVRAEAWERILERRKDRRVEAKAAEEEDHEELVGSAAERAGKAGF